LARKSKKFITINASKVITANLEKLKSAIINLNLILYFTFFIKQNLKNLVGGPTLKLREVNQKELNSKKEDIIYYFIVIFKLQ